MKPICIDLFCGLGGWAHGFLAEGYRVIGFDIERHAYGEERYPGDLVLQDARTLHGSQFRNATCIVASPPCQRYSRMAMPFSIFKAEAARLRSDPSGREIVALNELFESCFRIQREASEAAGRHIPMVVENVRGAQPWIGQAQARYGSYYLWGDVATVAGDGIYAGLTAPTWDSPILRADGSLKGFGSTWFGIQSNGDRYDQRDANPISGRNDPRDLRRDENGDWRALAEVGVKCTGQQHGFEFAMARGPANGVKQGGTWWHDPESISRKTSSKSHARKAASMRIAKIPFALSSYIARQFLPAGVYSERALSGHDAEEPIAAILRIAQWALRIPPLDKSPQPGAK